MAVGRHRNGGRHLLFLDRTWFLDANYSYANDRDQIDNWSGPWSDMTLTAAASRRERTKGSVPEV